LSDPCTLLLPRYDQPLVHWVLSAALGRLPRSAAHDSLQDMKRERENGLLSTAFRSDIATVVASRCVRNFLKQNCHRAMRVFAPDSVGSRHPLPSALALRSMNSFWRHTQYHDPASERWHPGDWVAHITGMAYAWRERMYLDLCMQLRDAGRPCKSECSFFTRSFDTFHFECDQ
jgi:hypothetical protein